jgi:hypothetical protein
VARLLILLLVELLPELLYHPALLSVVAPGVVHWAPWTTLIAVGGLAWSLVTSWATTPTSRYSNSSGSGSTCQRLVVVAADLLLLLILVLVATLNSGICFGLVGLPCLRSRLGVSCTPLCSPGALVR